MVVEKEYPWSRDPAYDYTKCQEGDDDDDVEGLLAPRNNVQQHQWVFFLILVLSQFIVVSFYMNIIQLHFILFCLYLCLPRQDR